MKFLKVKNKYYKIDNEVVKGDELTRLEKRKVELINEGSRIETKIEGIDKQINNLNEL